MLTNDGDFVFGFAALPALIDTSVKGAILLAVVAIGLRYWRRSSATMRHMAWGSAMAALLILPILSMSLPHLKILPDWTGAPVPTTHASSDRSKHVQSIDVTSEDHLHMPPPEYRNEVFYSSDTLVTDDRDSINSVKPEEKMTIASTVEQQSIVEPGSPIRNRESDVTDADRRIPSSAWLIGFWATGVMVLLLRLIVSHFGLWRLSRRCDRVINGHLRTDIDELAMSFGIRRRITLLISCDRHIPMTWGLFRPHLLLPCDASRWDIAQLNSVLTHELAHVKRWDCQTQLLAQLACAVHWMNPLAWLAVNRMDLEREQAVDDVALLRGISAIEYAEHLVGVASGLNQSELATLGAMAMACPSRLESRLLTVLNAQSNRGLVTTGQCAALVAMLSLIVLPISMLSATGAVGDVPGEKEQRQIQPANQARQESPDVQNRDANEEVIGVSKEADWSAIVDGLQFRLSTSRTDFESWELPTFQWEIRNRTDQPVTAEKAASLIGELLVRPGMLFLFQDQHRRAPTNDNRRVVPQVRLDTQKIGGLESGKTIAVTVTLASLREETTPQWGMYDLVPGRYSIVLANDAGRFQRRDITNAVALNILPPGIRKRAELAAYLKPEQVGDQKIEVGFIPDKTEIVWGEPIVTTMVIQNNSAESFAFSFGGDYRGTGRHERFKIDVTGSDGQLLTDPHSDAFGGGGILSWRTAQPMDVVTETIDLTTFRRFPGPGEYTVTCRFDLTPTWTDESRKSFNIPMKTSYKLSILPREPNHVKRVLTKMFERCQESGSGSLVQLINTICSFGKNDAVPGLKQMIATQDAEHRIAAAGGLGKLTIDESLDVLLAAVNDEQLPVRVAVITALGQFTDARAVQAIVRAMSDQEEAIRTTAAMSLGTSKTGDAVEALIQKLPNATPSVAAAILRGMGSTKSPRVFEILERSLESDIDVIRRAALDAIINFPQGDSVPVLKRLASHSNLDFRELVVRNLAEKYRHPVDPNWLIPVIQSRKKANSIGDAPRLLRLFSEDLAAPALLSCLDFENPDIRSYYNLTIIDNQLACNGMAIPWISDLNREGTPDEIEKNRQTLKRIKSWVDHTIAHPRREPPLPWRLSQAKEEATWGAAADDFNIRAHVNRTIWPQGLPQVVTIESRSASRGGSITFNEPLAVCDVEVNGEWYSRDPKGDHRVSGDWHAYHGNAESDLQLDARWKRKSDNQALDLKPGQYKIRVRLHPKRKDREDEMPLTKPITFDVIPTSN